MRGLVGLWLNCSELISARGSNFGHVSVMSHISSYWRKVYKVPGVFHVLPPDKSHHVGISGEFGGVTSSFLASKLGLSKSRSQVLAYEYSCLIVTT